MLVVCLLLALAIASVIWSWRSLKLDADTDSLIGESQPFMVDYRAFKRAFGDLEFLIVAVDAWPPGAQHPRHAEAQGAVLALVERLRKNPRLAEVHGMITPTEQMRLAPRSVGMTESDLGRLVKASDAFGSIIEGRPASLMLAEAEARLDRLLPGASASPPRLDRAAQEREGAAAIFTLQAIAAGAETAETDPGFALARMPSPQWLSPSKEPGKPGRFYFIKILPPKDTATLAVIERPLAEIREVIRQVQNDFPDIGIGLTGKPVLQADEMSTTSRDMTIATIVGTILCAALFMIVFRGIKRPLLAVATFAVGMALTNGAATLLVGRLNLLSIVFMLVLVGVGLDYGIHMTARYVEGLRHLRKGEAIRHMMRTSVPSNLTGAAVAGGTFLIALITPFQGLRELGLISGVGLLLCMLVMAALLPVLLDRFDRGEPGRGAYIMGRRRSEPAFTEVSQPILGRRHVVLVIVLLAGAVVWTIVGWRTIGFESNLLELQARDLSAVRWERRILESDASETWFGVAIVGSIDGIPPLVDAATREPEIGAVRSVLSMAALPTPARASLLTALGAATEPAARPPDPAPPGAAAPGGAPPLDAAAVRGTAGKVDTLATFAALAAPDQAGPMRALAARLRALADGLDPAKHDAAMIDARRLAVTDSIGTVRTWLLEMGAGARGTLREAIPDAVRDEFTSPDGLYAVRLHPAQDVWEFEPMASFVAAMRRVDPRVTGIPITTYESMLLLERSFLIQGIVASIFVALVLLVDLHRVGEAIACLLALGTGIAWTLGAMALLGVDFNLANFFAIPISLGLGSDACVHIAHRAREGLAVGFGSTRRAVTVTALTTVIGFGALLFAQHRGLQSLGLVMFISTLAMLYTTTQLLPALLRVLARIRSST